MWGRQQAIEKEDEEMRHFPRKTKGCYYQHPETCCWLCQVRTIGAVIRLWWSGQRKTAAEFVAGFIGGLTIALALVGLVTVVRALLP
jgi:hypothetical protein